MSNQEIADVIAPMGLRLSPAKTQIAHIDDGFEFLGFRIRRRRKRGTNKWYVYTFIADRPVRQLKAKIRALTRTTSPADLHAALIRINQIQRGWANYFRHAVAKRTFHNIGQFVWWRLVRWQMQRHRWSWKKLRRWLTTPNGRWKPISADETDLFNIAAVTVTRYRFRGAKIPNRWIGTEPQAT